MLYTIGMNHAGAPLAVREHMTYSDETRAEALAALREVCQEVAVLDTCNRSEVYASDPSADLAPALEERLRAFHRLAPEAMLPYRYVLEGKAAASHLFAVASGLDSLVLGEAQILSQVNGALEFCAQHGACGPVLSAMFRHALNTGKRARTETSIARGALSLGSLAIERAQATLGSLHGRSALVIGTGTMGTLTARGLRAAGAGQLWIVSRRVSRAQVLADEVGAQTLPFEQIPAVLTRVDAMFSATAAPFLIVPHAMVADAMAARSQALCIVDLALPRDVEPSVAAIPGVQLYDLDGLRAGMEQNLARRQSEIAAVQAIVDAETESFWAWLQSLSVAPEIAALRRRGEQIRQRELAERRGQLQGLSPQEWKAVESMTASIVGQMLHAPTLRLKARASAGDGTAYAHMLRDLFALDDSNEA
jgi:glutamyl-tRNA reductase